MNLLLREVHKSPSLIAFSDYREAEALNELQTSVSRSGELLEYETLELRVHPPNINIDNDFSSEFTLITVDSANRPGTLVEVQYIVCHPVTCWLAHTGNLFACSPLARLSNTSRSWALQYAKPASRPMADGLSMVRHIPHLRCHTACILCADFCVCSV